jgi:hypothetical protein
MVVRNSGREMMSNVGLGDTVPARKECKKSAKSLGRVA